MTHVRPSESPSHPGLFLFLLPVQKSIFARLGGFSTGRTLCTWEHLGSTGMFGHGYGRSIRGADSRSETHVFLSLSSFLEQINDSAAAWGKGVVRTGVSWP